MEFGQITGYRAKYCCRCNRPVCPKSKRGASHLRVEGNQKKGAGYYGGTRRGGESRRTGKQENRRAGGKLVARDWWLVGRRP
jgi:hypothetical protein